MGNALTKQSNKASHARKVNDDDTKTHILLGFRNEPHVMYVHFPMYFSEFEQNKTFMSMT